MNELAIGLPRLLGPYTLLKRVATGGMAEVYLAKVMGPGGFAKLVALKVIHPHYSEDAAFVRMLIDEAKVAVSINHNNVVRTFDLGCVDNTYFIVMEHIDGADLYRIFHRAAARRQPVPMGIAVTLMMEVCRGLHHVHTRAHPDGQPMVIVHRDISPQNILVSYMGEVKILDFGIAKTDLHSQQTDAGVLKGKYYYMSPEQACGLAVDQRSDIYSTAVVLYELLVGETLFAKSELPQLLEQVRQAQIPLPSSRRSDIPPQLDALLLCALARQREDRFSSALDFAKALEAFLRKQQLSVSSAQIADYMAQLFPDEAAAARRIRTSNLSLPEASDTPSHTEHWDDTTDLDHLDADEFEAIAHRESVLFPAPPASDAAPPA
ncbi:MAG: serine/threonine protein kinase, partial [Polyangiales bacterium]